MLRFGSLFSGIGLLDFGLDQAGIEHAWFCESDGWRREVLRKRWPRVPVREDVQQLRARDLEPVDGIVGGFPCKGASSAGKQEGFDHPETVLWREMARIVGEVRPRYVVLENVANLLTIKKGLVWQEVLETLATLGFDVVWDCLPAAAVGAPHRRDRVFAIAAYAAGDGRTTPSDADEPPGMGSDARAGTHPTPDSSRVPEGGAEAQAGADGQRTGAGADAAADAQGGSTGRESKNAPQWLETESHGVRSAVVQWGVYEPAIKRWEAVQGPVPKPLVSRVDDRSAARVERFRLSALGDGVQVQVGRIVGEYVIWLEQQRKQQKERTHV